MKKQMFWIAVLLFGTLPFLFPFFWGFSHMSTLSQPLLTWVMTYSFLHWPTYLIGMFVIPIAIYNLLKHYV